MEREPERSVWLVVTGQYEDRGVSAAFDNEAAAEGYAEMRNRREYDEYAEVEEYDLLSRCPEEATVYRCYKSFGAGPNHDYCRAELRDDRGTPFAPLMEVKAVVYDSVEGHEFAVVEVMGTDEELVKETFAERVAGVRERMKKIMGYS